MMLLEFTLFLDMVFLYTTLHVVIGYMRGTKVKPESIIILLDKLKDKGLGLG